MSTATVSSTAHDGHVDVLPLDGQDDLERELIGGKAWSIQQMQRLGMPVPPAFVITTRVCREYYSAGRTVPERIWTLVVDGLAALEKATDRRFGAPERPLLVSVRSGAAVSMPGMMDTILNLGMTDDIERALAVESGDPAYAADLRRRFGEQFASVVGAPAPVEPLEQLRRAVVAVLDSWESPRAAAYRSARGLDDAAGTAVTIQAMVFGNLGSASGTGVLFSRNPLTGDAAIYGEWLPGGQGEDVVSGRMDAAPLAELATTMPAIHQQLSALTETLEHRDRDIQDIEFTVEQGRLWLLQSRSAKRTPEAAVRAAVAMVDEGLITASQALDRISGDHVRALVRPHLDARSVASLTMVAQGKSAAPGIGIGVICTDTERAEDLAEAGTPVVLARPTTDPDDVAAMSSAVAVLTELGGATSHAAVVCREMAIPCVVGCGTETVTDLDGQTVTVDATAGRVFLGPATVTATPSDSPDLERLRQWLTTESGSAVHDLASGLDARELRTTTR